MTRQGGAAEPAGHMGRAHERDSAANGLEGNGHPAGLARYFPILDWGRRYDRDALANDLIAAVIVTIMLIPQSLAYALLAGLPP
jgi:Sulfate permease family